MYDKELSRRERLLIFRRRLGITQVQMAQNLKMSPVIYKQYERGQREVPGELTHFKLGKLTLIEELIVNRKRKGFTQQQLADRMGISRVWLNLMEKEKVEAGRLKKHFRRG